MAGPKVGDVAPDFSLKGVPEGEYRLGAERGKYVVLAFYPADFSPVCTDQLQDYSYGIERLRATGATIWGISADDLARHERFARSRALQLPLLSDDGGRVAELYGVKRALGPRARRSLFVVDPAGVVRHRSEEPLSVTYRSADDVIDALEVAGARGGRPTSDPLHRE